MGRVAIFVDAGYLFAQGSIALTGTKRTRTDLKLNETAAIAELTAVGQAKSNSAEILRVYWYDGVVGFKGPTLQQIDLAHLDNVKMRFGFVNSYGQQKGVDSLIVTDLIELARNHAISDAVLLSGDEDVRIGVQIAQNFGVRIHLIGIHPSRGSQSRQLLQEADTTTEWDKTTVSKFLLLSIPVPPVVAVVAAPVKGTPSLSGTTTTGTGTDLGKVAEGLASSLDSTTVLSLKAYWTSKLGIPPEFDGKLLARGRAAIGRDLTPDEKKQIRSKFKAVVSAGP